MGRLSRMQLRFRHPDLQIQVLSDQSRNDSLGELWQTNLCVGVDVPLSTEPACTWQRIDSLSGVASREIKTQLFAYSPFDETLYLDNDTLVVGKLDEIWQFLEAAPIAAALDIQQTLGAAVESGLHYRQLTPEEAEVTLKTCGESAPYFNTGVLLWHTCPASEFFFREWHRQWQRFGRRDQFAFARALAVTRQKIATLPACFNQPVLGELTDAVRTQSRILHFWLPPKRERMERELAHQKTQTKE
jgi:hypothetical protein